MTNGAERETFHSALHLGVKALVGLGYQEHRALRIARAFERHDANSLEQSYKVRDDEEAFMGYLRESRDLLDQVMQSDKQQSERRVDSGWHQKTGEIGKEAKARAK